MNAPSTSGKPHLQDAVPPVETAIFPAAIAAFLNPTKDTAASAAEIAAEISADESTTATNGGEGSKQIAANLTASTQPTALSTAAAPAVDPNMLIPVEEKVRDDSTTTPIDGFAVDVKPNDEPQGFVERIRQVCGSNFGSKTIGPDHICPTCFRREVCSDSCLDHSRPTRPVDSLLSRLMTERAQVKQERHQLRGGPAPSTLENSLHTAFERQYAGFTGKLKWKGREIPLARLFVMTVTPRTRLWGLSVPRSSGALR